MNRAWDLPHQKRGPLLFVAGGPSSDHLDECLTFGEVAIVNQAVTLLSGTADWLVAADLEALYNVRAHWHRIARFLVSERLHVNSADSPVALSNAACAGLHLLARMGYSPIWMVGHDGGFGYGANYAVQNTADPKR